MGIQQLRTTSDFVTVKIGQGKTAARYRVVLLQLTVLVIFGPRGLKGMAKHCIFEHFLGFVKQIRPKPSVVVTLHGPRAVRGAQVRGPAVLSREVLSSLVRHGTVSSWYLIARRVLQYQITIY